MRLENETRKNNVVVLFSEKGHVCLVFAGGLIFIQLGPHEYILHGNYNVHRNPFILRIIYKNKRKRNTGCKKAKLQRHRFFLTSIVLNIILSDLVILTVFVSLLLLCGNVELNPGPTPIKGICRTCGSENIEEKCSVSHFVNNYLKTMKFF
jgi:hypothetical protein